MNKGKNKLFSVGTIVLLSQLIIFCSFSQTSIKSDDDIYLYIHVDKLPSFPGGSHGLKEFIKTNLKWPDQEIGVHGIVLVSFIVKKSGEIESVIVERSLHQIFDTEAVNLIKKMPKWNTGEINMQPVSVKLYLPIEFIIR